MILLQLTNITKLNPQQNTDIEILVSKQQHFTTELLYKIQLVVEKQDMLLVNSTDEPYLENIGNHQLKNKIVIIRSKRRRNYLINYNFLKNYNDLLFLGLEDEYEELKKDIPNLEFFDCKDFLEMAEIINSCKLFIGNLSFGFTYVGNEDKEEILNEKGPSPKI